LARAISSVISLRVAKHRLVPAKSQPFEIEGDRFNEALAAAALIDVFDADQKIVAALIGGNRREGVAAMKIAGGTGCETRDDHSAMVSLRRLAPTHWSLRLTPALPLLLSLRLMPTLCGLAVRPVTIIERI
jgi:hypothetical protein